MNLLGIDYGRAKVGIAISSGSLAEPLKTIRYSDTDRLFNQIGEILKLQNIDSVVIGLSEGKMLIETKNFGKALQEQLKVKVEYFDETLTSSDAQKLAQAAGIKRKKRKSMEDAYAAALMLQGYLDNRLHRL